MLLIFCVVLIGYPEKKVKTSTFCIFLEVSISPVIVALFSTIHGSYDHLTLAFVLHNSRV